MPNKGDTAWMLISTVLVLMMTIPGLALFYGGLVRTKNMLSVLTQVFAIVCLVGDDLGDLRLQPRLHQRRRPQRLRRRLLARPSCAASTPTIVAATFSNGVVIPEFVYIVLPDDLRLITPALIVGAFAERMKFSALVLFMVLWVTFIYFPIAHMVWYWGGPDAIADAAKALADATDAAAKAAAQAKLDEVTADAGLHLPVGRARLRRRHRRAHQRRHRRPRRRLCIGKRIGYGTRADRRRTR